MSESRETDLMQSSFDFDSQSDSKKSMLYQRGLFNIGYEKGIFFFFFWMLVVPFFFSDTWQRNATRNHLEPYIALLSREIPTKWRCDRNLQSAKANITQQRLAERFCSAFEFLLLC